MYPCCIAAEGKQTLTFCPTNEVQSNKWHLFKMTLDKAHVTKQKMVGEGLISC